MTQDKLACPSCGAFLSKVLRVAPLRDLMAYRRRRECLDCGERFWTQETVQPPEKVVEYPPTR